MHCVISKQKINISETNSTEEIITSTIVEIFGVTNSVEIFIKTITNQYIY